MKKDVKNEESEDILKSMNIGIDFDGVLNTYNEIEMGVFEDIVACQLGYVVFNSEEKNAKGRYGIKDSDYSIYHIKRHNHINSENFYGEMIMMNNAASSIAQLNSLGHKTFLVTARGCDANWNIDPNARKYIFNVLVKWGLIDAGLIVDDVHSFSCPVIKKIDKVPPCKNLGIDILIDDDMINIENVREAGIQGIHFGKDAKDWEDVVARIQNVTKSKQGGNHYHGCRK